MLHAFPMYAYIPASDMARARKFYEEQVGLVPTQETNGGVVYTFAGGTACFLYPTPNAGSSQASQAFWVVSDVDGLIRQLEARGVVFEDYDMPGEKSAEGAVTAGGAKAAWFRDSEGEHHGVGRGGAAGHRREVAVVRRTAAALAGGM